MSKKIRKAIEKAIEKSKKVDESVQISAEKRKRLNQIKLELITSGDIRFATEEDYAEWLRGFLENGGQISDVGDRNMPWRLFYVAQRSFTLPVEPAVDVILFIDDNLLLIVPKGMKVENKDFHYCIIYPLDYSKTPGYVPLFNDIKEILLSK